MNDLPQETTIDLDVPDDRDFVHDDLFGSIDETPDKIEFYPEHIQNQASFPDTKMACSRFGMTHGINAQNRYVHWQDWMRFFEFPARNFWQQYLKVNPKAKTEGATLQSVLDQFLKLWLITGYSKTMTIESMKNALRNIRFILTWSYNGNWVKVRDEKIYALRTDWKTVWHIFVIVGYDDKGWIAINSYWANNGIFHIPYNLTDTLFTRYAVSDSRDEEIILSYNK